MSIVHSGIRIITIYQEVRLICASSMFQAIKDETIETKNIHSRDNSLVYYSRVLIIRILLALQRKFLYLGLSSILQIPNKLNLE